MALILKKLYLGYYWLFQEKADPRSTDLGLFMMSSPIYPVATIAFWLYFVLNLGPKLMQDKKPFNLKNVMIVYNLTQILINLYIAYEAFIEVFFHLNWYCAPIDYNATPRGFHVVKVYHTFFLTKFLDLFDTVFFVLRKKNNQLSFLHVYHHFGMFLMLWIAVKFFCGGHGAWVGVVNASVHVIMYTYYLLTALDDKWKQNYAWKKFITQVQMVQFMFFIIIFGRLFMLDRCDYPKLISFFFVPQNVFMFLLFFDFYKKTYWNAKKPVKTD